MRLKQNYWIFLPIAIIFLLALIWKIFFQISKQAASPVFIQTATDTIHNTQVVSTIYFPYISKPIHEVQVSHVPMIIKQKIGSSEYELTVLSEPPVYPGFGLENALDNDPNDDYVAALAIDSIPQSFIIGITPSIAIQAIKFIWESSDNYAVAYSIDGMSEGGQLIELAHVTDGFGQQQVVQIEYFSDIKLNSITVSVSKFAGQPRLLLRKIEFINSQSSPSQLTSSRYEKAYPKIAIIEQARPDPNFPIGQCIPSFILLSSYTSYLSEDLHTVDDTGVVVTNYGGDLGLQYNPYGISLIGMAGFNAWCKDHDKTGLKVGLIQADWLVDHLVNNSKFGTWLYQFPNELYFAPSGWSSSLGNAFGMACLVQAYNLTKDKKYKQAAISVIPSFVIEIKNGGVRSTLINNDDAFFEEVAYPSAPPSYILNADVFALESLDYIASYLHDQTANKIFHKGLNTLKAVTNKFDASVITLYALNSAEGLVSSSRLHYGHYVHMEGMFWAYHKTQDPFFLRYAFRWTNMTRKPFDMEVFTGCLQCKSVQNYPTGNIIYLSPDTTEIYFDLFTPQVIRSFGYNALGPYPVNYEISFSNDGKVWFNSIQIVEYTKADNIIKIPDITARYLKLSWTKLSSPPGRVLRFGVFRVDGPDYWEKPIILAGTGGGHLLANSTTAIGYLTDGNTNTAILFEPPSKIYVDVRKPQLRGTLILDGRTDVISSCIINITVEASSDMKDWLPILNKSIELNGYFHKELLLSDETTYWQFLRIHLNGTANFYLSEVKIDP